MDVKTKLLTLALTAAGLAAVAVAQAQPAPAPTAPPPAPAPTTTTDPNAPPPPTTNPNAPPAPTATTTSTAQPPPAPPPAGTGAAPQDPNAPPAPPPAVQPPPPQQPPPVVPPPQPVPPPVAQPQPQPQPPPAEPPKPKGMTLLQRFAGSSIGWNHSVSLTTLGFDTREGPIGTNYSTRSVGVVREPSDTSQPGIGIDPSNDSYTQSLTFTPAFFIFKGQKGDLLERHAIRAFTQVSMNVELTNSDTTTYYRQPDIADIPLRLTDVITLASWGGGDASGVSAGALARDPTLAGAAEYRTWGILTAGLNFPTSRVSRGSSLFLTSHLALGLRQQIKILGSSSDYLSNITVTLSETWQHQFSKASTRVNDDLNIPRQDSNGNPINSDQLGGVALAENRLIHNINFFLPVYGDLQLNGQFQVFNEFPYQFKGSDCEVTALTGCVNLPESEAKMRGITNFDVSLYYQVSPELGVDIGYNNFSGQLLDNSRIRNPIFSTSSLFYADITVFPDQLIKRLTAPPKPQNQTGRR